MNGNFGWDLACFQVTTSIKRQDWLWMDRGRASLLIVRSGPRSPCGSIQAEPLGSVDSALNRQSHLQGCLHCLYQMTSALLPQILLVQLSFLQAVSKTSLVHLVGVVCFDSLITKMKRIGWISKKQSNLRKWVPRQFLWRVGWCSWDTKCYFRPAQMPRVCSAAESCADLSLDTLHCTSVGL